MMIKGNEEDWLDLSKIIHGATIEKKEINAFVW